MTKLVAEVAVPAWVVTVIGPVVAPAGASVTISVAVSETIRAVVPLKATLVARPRLRPVMVTRVPAGPDPGFSPEICGVTDVVIRPMVLSPPMNHSAPSGPAVITKAGAGEGYRVTAPEVVIRPTAPSANQSAPSDPAAMPVGLKMSLPAKLLTVPAVVILPIEAPPRPSLVNQSAPSGPAVIPLGDWMLPLGSVNVLTIPLAVMRPIDSCLPLMNHSAPSGPAVMSLGW